MAVLVLAGWVNVAVLVDAGCVEVTVVPILR